MKINTKPTGERVTRSEIKEIPFVVSSEMTHHISGGGNELAPATLVTRSSLHVDAHLPNTMTFQFTNDPKHNM